jgi:putative 4-mercaptohistidine N1-methyltranferase
VDYESDKQLSEYMMLHYGAADDVLPFRSTPREWLDFPQRCAQLLDTWASRLHLPKRRVLDIGCAVGGSSFELARTFESVIGVDSSAKFIEAAKTIGEEGSVAYFRRDQGVLGETCVASLGAAWKGEERAGESVGHVAFEQGDACALPSSLGQFDACLLANLLCRLPDPEVCLSRLGGDNGLVKPGGLAVIVSPYTWMEEHTTEAKWLGGYTAPNGQPVYSDATLRSYFSANGFELLDEIDMPLIIREHERKYQLIVSHAMVFRRQK